MKQKICIKIGGTAADETEAVISLLEEIKELDKKYSFILVHGGGKEVSSISRVFGMEPQFTDGIRQTSPAEMDIVEMVLAGKVNKKLVRAAGSIGLKAVGISGSDDRLFTGTSLGPYSRTGKIDSVNTEIISILHKNNILPVISSVSMDESGGGLNINADEAALEIAEALKAEVLIYISDTAGVLIQNKIVPELNEKECQTWIKKGEISGGMVPKVKSSLDGLRRGIRRIIIGDYQEKGDILKFICKEKGTSLCLKEE